MSALTALIAGILITVALRGFARGMGARLEFKE